MTLHGSLCTTVFCPKSVSYLCRCKQKVRVFAAARREKSGSLPCGLLENGQEDMQDNAQDVDECC